MELNNIHLSPAVVSGLYASSLVIAEDTAAPTVPAAAMPVSATKEVTEKSGWKSLGNNKKNILIAVKYEDAVYLPDEELTFLTNMLTACKLSLADVAIINLYDQESFSYKAALEYFKSTRIFLFGIEPVEFGLPVSFPVFQVQSFSNSTYLYAPSLEENRNDKLLKSKLWLCLQRIFAI